MSGDRSGSVFDTACEVGSEERQPVHLASMAFDGVRDTLTDRLSGLIVQGEGQVGVQRESHMRVPLGSGGPCGGANSGGTDDSPRIPVSRELSGPPAYTSLRSNGPNCYDPVAVVASLKGGRRARVI